MSGCGPGPQGAAFTDLGAVEGANAVWQVSVGGLHCDGCASGLRKELLRTEGVTGAQVHFGRSLAQVAVDTNRVTLEAVAKVIADAGYQMGAHQP